MAKLDAAAGRGDQCVYFDANLGWCEFTAHLVQQDISTFDKSWN
jgi:hypothetical protein